jgi:hypothetical protein
MENNLYDYELRSVYEQLDIKQGISDIVRFSTKVTIKKHVKIVQIIKIDLLFLIG